jgi:hypothetical protein
MGSSLERGRRGKGKEERGHSLGVAWGEGGLQEGCHGGSALLLIWFSRSGLLCEKNRSRKEKKKRKKKKRKNKKKIWKIFQT